MSVPQRRHTVAGLLRAAAAALADAGVESARLDAELLLAEAWGADRTKLFVAAEASLPTTVVERFELLLERRRRREPLAYVIGRREFWSLDFAVSPAVLVPRPETECLIEAVLAHAAPAGQLSVCDVGTGSGCIAVTLAHERPAAQVLALDVSLAALQVADRNARRHQVRERLELVAGDLLSAIAGRFDFIVSNPPYIDPHALRDCAPELGWEPRGALDGGAHGLAVIRRLAEEALEHLHPEGWLMFEIGYDQRAAVIELLTTHRWRNVEVRPDYQGHPRVALAQRPFLSDTKRDG